MLSKYCYVRWGRIGVVGDGQGGPCMGRCEGGVWWWCMVVVHGWCVGWCHKHSRHSSASNWPPPPSMHPSQRNQIYSNPQPIPMPFKPALFRGPQQLLKLVLTSLVSTELKSVKKTTKCRIEKMRTLVSKLLKSKITKTKIFRKDFWTTKQEWFRPVSRLLKLFYYCTRYSLDHRSNH